MESGSGRQGSGLRKTLLTAVSALVAVSVVGGGAWLYLTHEASQQDVAAHDGHGGVPRVTMSLSRFHDAAPMEVGTAAVDGTSPIGDDDKPPGPDAAAQKGKQLAAAGLFPHPDPSLIEKSDLGPLPVIGKDGRMPWRVYARPFSQLDKRPRVAIVVTMLGVSENATRSAIETLPGEITLSYAPFVKNLAEWIDKSREAGHEVLIDLPMEPLDFPQSDPGPHTLLASVPIDQNLRQLGWVLSRATGYVGVATYMGAGLADNPRSLNPIYAELKNRGLMLVDTHENRLKSTEDVAKEVGLTITTADMFVDSKLSEKQIDAHLAEIEKLARANGSALAIARPYPLTLKRLAAWSAGLRDKGIALAPVSALPAGKGKH
jgi:hypothetical protein